MSCQWDVFRRVALKLPQAGIEAPTAMARRFESERDLLAGLEHPHIARLYDAGVGAAGQPFLAMELISGQPITEHARGLPLRRRLALFLQVLGAVSFAHNRLVIHRDLKPSNLLVTPEQLAGAPLGAASDAYSLGVVLYELLTGQRPYTLDRQGAVNLARQLANATVLPPRLAVPAQRQVAAGDLAGDPDAIVARAMALEPAERYPSAEALAADIHRHLDGLREIGTIYTTLGDKVQARAQLDQALAL